MNRIMLTFLMLVFTGGCMAVDPDPINESPYGVPQRSAAQGQASPMTRQPGWGYSDGRSVTAAPSALATRSSTAGASATKSWANPPQSTTAANKPSSSASSTSTATAAKPASPRPVAKPASPRPVAAKTDKSDDTLVKTAAYSETKPVEAESPPVNLGMLRLINSKRIVIRYEVKDPASTGVSDLEVWGTTDMHSWKKYDPAKRLPSSLVVTVPGEGLYGFTVLARAKNEQTKNQPPANEPPQMWVAVDLTKPVVQLLGAEMSMIEKTPALVVRWNVTDRNLGPRPITLVYAERPEGPWTPLAANLENRGHYEWAMPACVPDRVLVRVLAADLMGNVGMAQSATLRIPERPATSTRRTAPTLTELPSPSSSLSPAYQPALRPIAAREPKPTTSILAVDGE